MTGTGHRSQVQVTGTGHRSQVTGNRYRSQVTGTGNRSQVTGTGDRYRSQVQVTGTVSRKVQECPIILPRLFYIEIIKQNLKFDQHIYITASYVTFNSVKINKPITCIELK